MATGFLKCVVMVGNGVTLGASIFDLGVMAKKCIHGGVTSSDKWRVIADLAVSGMFFGGIVGKKRIGDILKHSFFTTTCSARETMVEEQANYTNLFLLLLSIGCGSALLGKIFSAKMEEFGKGWVSGMAGICYSHIVAQKADDFLPRLLNWWHRNSSRFPENVRSGVVQLLQTYPTPEQFDAIIAHEIPTRYWHEVPFKLKKYNCCISHKPIREVAKLRGEEGRYYEKSVLIDKIRAAHFLDRMHGKTEVDVDISSYDVRHMQSVIDAKIALLRELIVEYHEVFLRLRVN